MRTLVLDTNIVSYLMKRHSLAEAYRPHLDGCMLAISFMTVAEMYEGAYRARWGTRKLGELHRILQGFTVLPASPATCRHWGEIRAERARQPISPDDAWVAACARARALPLVTHNPRDFTGISNLTVVTEHREEPAP